jgi:cytochrome c556
MTNAPFSMSSALIRAAIATVLLLPLGLVSAARAEQHDSPRVKYRQTLMSIIGSNMGAMGDIMKNQLDLPGHVANHAGQMAQSARLIALAFEQNVSTTSTDAKPEIWQDWAKFEKAIATFEKAARNLEATAAGSDQAAVGPAMKALGKSCGGCHKQFRKPKEESYKNKARNHKADEGK